jgi:hypothetical protein
VFICLPNHVLRLVRSFPQSCTFPGSFAEQSVCSQHALTKSARTSSISHSHRHHGIECQRTFIGAEQHLRTHGNMAVRSQTSMAISFANNHSCETKLTFQASSFSAALNFTKELAFGVLAILGCIVVQCLILAFILVSAAQIRFVFLQARMLRQLYGQPSEKRPSADGQKTKKEAGSVKGDFTLASFALSLTDDNSRTAQGRTPPGRTRQRKPLQS